MSLAAQRDDPGGVVQGQRAGDAGGGDLALGVADHRGRLDAVRAPQRGQRTITANSAGCTTSTRSSAGASAAPRSTSTQRPVDVRGERRGALGHRARRTPGEASSSSRPMPAHCEPWPGNTKTGLARLDGRRARHHARRAASPSASASQPGAAVPSRSRPTTTARCSKRGAVGRQRAADVGRSQRRVLACRWAQQPRGLVAQRGVRSRADSTHGTRPARHPVGRGSAAPARLGGLLEDDVRVGAADAERGHRRPGAAARSPATARALGQQRDRAGRPVHVRRGLVDVQRRAAARRAAAPAPS